MRTPACPAVTIVVVAFNEQDRVEPRLDNLLALDYPRDRLEIIFASDGSTDETLERARRYQSATVRVRGFDHRRGKAAVLDEIVPRARAEIVVLADARQTFDRAALKALVSNFADADVGAVSGELMLTSPPGSAAIGAGASLYWRYEKFIRRHESLANSAVGATGAIYAIRRALFEPIAEDTILDDVLIPMRVVGQGYRVLFEPAARAFDTTSVSARQEFVRKVRTIAGMFQLFARERWLFNPQLNTLWFETLSHKGLRLLTPLLHAIVLVSNVALVGVAGYRWLFAAQLLFYAAALVGHFRRGRGTLRVFTVPYTICLLGWATCVGFVYFVTRRQRATWERVGATTAAHV
jgi:cellulose synthase/poly-beta-1,6-N-acetylglucosamine synthase-like glycosyltransferase